ncbi:hypothetical protein Agub_g8177, partial [Astrephomene gubernaculifera]
MTYLVGRSEALFRPMAMVVPDCALVAEVALLSREVVLPYELASEQPSQRGHYDAVGACPRRQPPALRTAEEAVPRCASPASPSCCHRRAGVCAIVTDPFPGGELPNEHDEGLLGALVAACGALGLQ